MTLFGFLLLLFVCLLSVCLLLFTEPAPLGELMEQKDPDTGPPPPERM